MIDLRSDTVTKPTKEMLEFMIQAEVGDDVFGEDTTVNFLEKKVAHLFGKEAGVFVPSGTMSNQLGIHVLTSTGEEVIIHEAGHIFNYEGTSAAWLSNVQLHPITGHAGKLSAETIEATIRPKNDWDPHTSVISIENTTNRGGGAAYLWDELTAIKAIADQHKLKVHLDGARIWNAITATGIESQKFGEIADTISVCFSKGLGAPIGSMLLGSKEMMKKARRFRKVLGGGMRQVGILAAAADYAIDNNWSKMADDHMRAKELALHLNELDNYEVDVDAVESNIVIFELKHEIATDFLEKMKQRDILMVPFGPKKVRAVYHFEITDEMHYQVLRCFD